MGVVMYTVCSHTRLLDAYIILCVTIEGTCEVTVHLSTKQH